MMSLLSMLYTFIIAPLELLFEVIFEVANKIIGNAGLSIIFLSLAVNFLVFPLYKRADELQAEERDIQAKMAPRIKQIKSAFKGDERFMMLQEYYRINHYKPIYALKSSVSLLLQIPFFIAAYNLLSGMQSLQGIRFGILTNLGKEDALFMIGSFPVNVLPILMTIINIISGIIYTKGHPLRSKIQVYGLAAVFLVLLYRSPSGLVFYWLLNNVFSLVKNIFYKLKNPKKVLSIVLAVSGAVIFILTVIRPNLDIRQKVLLAMGCVLLTFPLLVSKNKNHQKNKEKPKDAMTFFCGAVFLALFTGLLIPSSVIKSSVEEFIDIVHPFNPMLYIVNSMLLSFGCFVLWGGIFYAFANNKTKSVLCHGVWTICGISIADYMLFGTNLGILSSTLQYKTEPIFSMTEHVLNFITVVLIAAVFIFIYSRFRKIATTLILAGILVLFCVGILNSAEIMGTYTWFFKYQSPSEEMPNIPLSKNGQNVVVLMIDRSLGTQVPYIINEKPELLEQFDGFTYYPNTISYGPATILASPALYGGYEYTPENINDRPSERLVSKHNEAMKVMPVLFEENNFEVTICDPTYAGYQEIPDLSIFDEYPDFNCYITQAKFNYFDDASNINSITDLSEQVNKSRNRNFFCYSIMKISPLILQETIYDKGLYNDSWSATSKGGTGIPAASQKRESITTGIGFDRDFMESYPVLTNLPKITTISENNENTFLLMINNTSHSPCLLQEPDYVPAVRVDNTPYDIDMVSRYTVNGVTMEMTTMKQVTHYHSNMATFIQLGKWFDYLREQGVWDNTRIILVADHGYDVGQFNITCNNMDMEFYMPLLMVKDFDATGFTVCEDFMTNADTPVLATEGLIENPVNPFTGNPIDSDFKNGPQKVFITEYCLCSDNLDRNTFYPGSWYVLDGNPHDPKSWSYAGFY